MNYIKLSEYIKLNKNKNVDVYILKKIKDNKYYKTYFNKLNKININNILNRSYYNVDFYINIKDNEVRSYNPFLIDKFSENNDILIKEKDKDIIDLISFNSLNEISVKDVNEGYLFNLKKVKNNYQLVNFDIVNSKYRLKYIVNELKKDNYLNDIYFYTNNESIINKSDNITKLKKINDNNFKIYNKKIIVLDSLNIYSIRNFKSSVINLIDRLSYNSIPISITDDGDNIKIENYKESYDAKKGYMIDENIETLIHYDSIGYLLPFINIYIINGNKIDKISLKDYCKEKNILKYIKKPN